MAKLTTYYRLLKQLKKSCGGRNPTQTEIENAMDDIGLPDDFEIDVDKLILDLSTFVMEKEDIEITTIKRVTRKYDKMALAAARLTTIKEDDVMEHHEQNERLRHENESLMNRLDEITERCPSR